MAESLKNDDKSIRSYILNDVLEKIPIDKSYENLCKVIGNDAIAFYDFQFWYYRFLSGKLDLDFDRSSEPEPLQFSGLPVDAVGLIVDKLKVEERLMLRRVSKPLRELIEKQGIDCTSINVYCGDDLIKVSYGGGRILYAKNDEPVKLYKNSNGVRKSLALYGDHFESEAFNDLAWIIKKPKLQFCSFGFSHEEAPWPPKGAVASKFLKNLEIVLKSLKHQISVQYLNLRPKHPDDVLAILPYLKPGNLETIWISSKMASYDWSMDENLRKVQRIMQLDQWKQADELSLWRGSSLFPDEALLQFKKYRFRDISLSKHELMRVGIQFAASPGFEYCYFELSETDEDNFLDFIGVPGPLTEGYRSVRHLMIPNTDKMLVFKEQYGDIEIEKKTRDAQ